MGFCITPESILATSAFPDTDPADGLHFDRSWRSGKLGAALGHDVSHSSAHAPEMKPEQKQEPAVTPQREITPKQEQSFDIGLGF